VIDVDEEIIEALFSMGVETEEARTMVRNNKHNCITATYYLLVAKRLRNPRNPAQFSPPKKPSVSVKSVNEIVSVSKVVGSINESQKKQMQNEQLFVSNKKDKLGTFIQVIICRHGRPIESVRNRWFFIDGTNCEEGNCHPCLRSAHL
jgi:hypothetical protein